jgi:Domain of unknown function (DUF4468) with TBP-like fold
MKKSVSIAFVLLMTTTVFCQSNFEWQIKDSVNKTKSEIYSITKQFIGTTWNSAQDVVQNDDKEGGVILVKGLTKSINFVHLGATYAYTYSYNVTIKMKENKYLFEINNVRFHSTIGSSFDNKLVIEPHENEKCEYSNKKFGEKCNQLMSSLKLELQEIADTFIKVMSSESISDGDW